jgi:large conductance mechanosensitive channel
MLKEFREFVAKGNMLDMAVGIIIGAAFTGVVNSLVKDIINPFIGLAGKANFDNMFVVLREGSLPGPYPTPAEAEEVQAVVLKYGSFITNVINFLIVAWVVFMIVKAANRIRERYSAPVEVAPAAPAEDVVLLTQIRDLLAKKA